MMLLLTDRAESGKIVFSKDSIINFDGDLRKIVMNEQEVIKNFGFKIKVYRRLNNVYQEDLAAGTGLSKSYLSNVENGKHSVSLVNALKIAKFFGKNINDFLDRRFDV